ncbi:MAG: beta-lactamase family protein [Propionibacteriaceae bacterium]|jgi:CubicO group peptidase (beta-lactamase class C family)|nr:beta-lactamase family protein [Propionibacteriaceae bacterium]
MIQQPFTVTRPEEVGVSSAAIRSSIMQIRDQHHLDLHSFLMLRQGRLIWEQYFRDDEADRRHYMFSVSKSFLSTACGLAQDRGLLSVDQPLIDFFPDQAHLFDSDEKRAITLGQMLSMSSGFENNEGEILHKTPPAEDMVPLALAQPLAHRPGRQFNYYTLGSFLISAAFSAVVPEGVHRYLRRELLDPMGFADSQWNVDDFDRPIGGFGLFLRAYDMARLGQLYLDKGVWRGEQLLSVDWVKAATSVQVGNPNNGSPDWCAGYGYQFWMNSFGGFRADGMFGQYIVVLPQSEAVVVMTSHLTDMQTPLTILKETLLPGIE